EDDKKRMLEYSWPGNIRELRNITEQLSVLSEERIITPEILLRIAPQLANRNLPSIIKGQEDDHFTERDILYKLLFEMKGDMNDLKTLVFELITRNQLNVGDLSNLRQLKHPTSQQDFSAFSGFNNNQANQPAHTILEPSVPAAHHTYLPDEPDEEVYQHAEEVEDVLSLDAMEKDLIQKALKKYNGRRKEAAKELGLSERTLYRKIKQYDING
ncbi:MAG TPA: helix-turn-helix domain-containing protein, partial [Saprospiraceae bacterium]|nr:helix-turn-helix domain-containing protein [Saprospiraceae bacterium]